MPVDFFISYSHVDASWAEWIGWQLESAGYTTILQAWDFGPGSSFPIEMQRASQSAERTLAVLSKDYLESSFTQPEWAAALARDPTGVNRRLVPVRVRPCNPEGILGTIVYIDLVDLDVTAAKNSLLNGVATGSGHNRSKPKSPPAFPRDWKQTPQTTVAVPPDFPAVAGTPTVGGRIAQSAHDAKAPEVRITVPDELLGTEPAYVELNFLIETAPATILVEAHYESHELLILRQAEPSATDTYHFKFSSPGTFQDRLQLRSRKPDDISSRLLLTCTDEAGRVISRNVFAIRVVRPPIHIIVILAAHSAAVYLWKYQRPTLALLVLALMAYGMYRITALPVATRTRILKLFHLASVSHLEWDSTKPDDWEMLSRVWDPPGCIHPLDGSEFTIQCANPVFFIEPPTAQLPRVTLSFALTMSQQQQTVTWIARADHLKQNYYRFTLKFLPGGSIVSAKRIRNGTDFGDLKEVDGNPNLVLLPPYDGEKLQVSADLAGNKFSYVFTMVVPHEVADQIAKVDPNGYKARMDGQDGYANYLFGMTFDDGSRAYSTGLFGFGLEQRDKPLRVSKFRLCADSDSSCKAEKK
jgi:hypothetical protein